MNVVGAMRTAILIGCAVGLFYGAARFLMSWRATADPQVAEPPSNFVERRVHPAGSEEGTRRLLTAIRELDLYDQDAEENPYRHDHNPLNADFTGGFCSACEWETDTIAQAESDRGDAHVAASEAPPGAIT